VPKKRRKPPPSAYADGATVRTTPTRTLATALTTRSRAKLPPGAFSVTAHTAKGRTAFDYLRGRVGL
jgi:hypothetical protein